MKKGRKTKLTDLEMRDEYEFSKARPNKYAKRYSEGGNLVVIDPVLAKYFPNSDSLNTALRALISAFPERRLK